MIVHKPVSTLRDYEIADQLKSDLKSRLRCGGFYKHIVRWRH